MLDFGEELSLESYRIPCLIWIQLIVFFLLLALFFLLSSDDSSTASASSASASASAATNPRRQKSLVNGNNNHHHVSTSTALTNRLQHTRGAENLSIKGEIETSSSTRTVREEIAEREGSPLYFLHPCHYFKLARVAFLKCLGLDSTESDSPPIRRPRKRKES
ncbi:hypothetical protein HN51_037037 [Arachis hypogaea]|uniref:Uncharacterized protein n=1 Tax=Arachis hypogaea TaxID=3818 RepID=A0A444ZXH2_ARAHY|nr:uncharacterized protein LOC107631130 [Arachis ipaensis]XP_025637930.1 uncharacterized protein LOC112733251 [Arachis hypogaea]QHO02519.1 uncharacterized protein DS421_13g424490 [Arachis hypogaea]RYR18878.1 hypothetical protein Ahy_B03g063491 [Arachis hypogaea]